MKIPLQLDDGFLTDPLAFDRSMPLHLRSKVWPDPVDVSVAAPLRSVNLTGVR